MDSPFKYTVIGTNNDFRRDVFLANPMGWDLDVDKDPGHRKRNQTRASRSAPRGRFKAAAIDSRVTTGANDGGHEWPGK